MRPGWSTRCAWPGNLSISLVAVDESDLVVGPRSVQARRALSARRMEWEWRRWPYWQSSSGAGIADDLVRRGLALCEQSDFGFVVVLGDPGYYSRFGFAPASSWHLSDEYGGGGSVPGTRTDAGFHPGGGRARPLRLGVRFARRLKWLPRGPSCLGSRDRTSLPASQP